MPESGCESEKMLHRGGILGAESQRRKRNDEWKGTCASKCIREGAVLHPGDKEEAL